MRMGNLLVSIALVVVTLMELDAQTSERVVLIRLHGAYRAAERLGHLGQREIAQEPQHDHGPPPAAPSPRTPTVSVGTGIPVPTLTVGGGCWSLRCAGLRVRGNGARAVAEGERESDVRRVVTGFDADGRSVVVSDGDAPVAFMGDQVGALRRVAGGSPEARPGPGQAVVNELWGLGAQPTMLAHDPTLAIEVASFDVAHAATKWIITEMGPGLEAAMHDTPTVDYGLVVRGDVELGLEVGSVRLYAGDCVLVNGVQHSWRAGPDGCVIATVQVGLRDADRR